MAIKHGDLLGKSVFFSFSMAIFLELSARWCPSLLAKLVHITSISPWFVVDILIYNIYIYTISIIRIWFINQLVT